MDENSWLLFAYQLDGKGSATSIDLDALKEAKQCWIHLNGTSPESEDWLRHSSQLPSLIVDALIADETRPRLLEGESGTLLILRGVNLNENAEPEDMVSIRVFVDEHRVISVRKRRLKAVSDIEEKLQHGNGPKTMQEIITGITSQLCTRMEPTLLQLDENTDDVEEQVLQASNQALRQNLVDIRKQAIIFRRYLSPQREVLQKLKTLQAPWCDATGNRTFQENYDRVTRYVEDLDAIRERSQIVHDELKNALTDKLNNNMYVLSVIAGIFLPLGFVTGLLGINVGGIPGTDSPQAFWYVTYSLVFVVFVQIAFFKRRKWF